MSSKHKVFIKSLLAVKMSISALVEHVSIDNMRQISVEMSPPDMKEMAEKHFRKGMVGDWKNYFEGEKLEEWNKWIEENMKDTDIKMSFE